MSGFAGQFEAFDSDLEVTLSILRRWKAEKDYFPTFREIAAEMGLSSPSRAHDRVKRLVEQGKVKQKQSGAIVWVEEVSL